MPGAFFRLKTRNRSGAPSVPVVSVAPIIAGTADADNTFLTLTPGVWLNTPTVRSYQWRSDGVAIPGETGLTFQKTPAYEGVSITVAEIASNTAGPSAPSVSNAIGLLVDDAELIALDVIADGYTDLEMSIFDVADNAVVEFSVLADSPGSVEYIY